MISIILLLILALGILLFSFILSKLKIVFVYSIVLLLVGMFCIVYEFHFNLDGNVDYASFSKYFIIPGLIFSGLSFNLTFLKRKRLV